MRIAVTCWESSIPLDLFAHTLHTTHTCLHTLPCARSGQPTAGTENWKSILYKSGDFSFQVFKNKQKHKMSLWLKITYFCRSPQKSPKPENSDFKQQPQRAFQVLSVQVKVKVNAWPRASPDRPRGVGFPLPVHW